MKRFPRLWLTIYVLAVLLGHHVATEYADDSKPHWLRMSCGLLLGLGAYGAADFITDVIDLVRS